MSIEELLKKSTELERQTSNAEAIELYNAVLNTPKGAVLEIGSASGGTTLMLIGASSLVDKMVYSVDPYPSEIEGDALYYTEGLMNKFKESFKRNILNGEYFNIIQYQKYLSECIDWIPELSLVFIDGCHELSEVQKEFVLIYPKVIKGGRIYIHDIQWQDGQKSKTKETGLSNIPTWIGGGEIIETMLKIQK